MDKAIVTCALTGVLTDPRHYPAPVTPEEMAREAKAACQRRRQRHPCSFPPA